MSVNTILYTDVIIAPDNDEPYLLKDRQLNTAIEALGLSADMVNALNQYPGERIKSHITRLLSLNRSMIEKRFGHALIKQVNTVLSSQFDTALKLISGESLDTTLWWNFSPYIYHQMLETSNHAPMPKLLEWANGAKEALHFSESHIIHLDGLTSLNEYGRHNTYVLNENESHITHLYTAQAAQKIIAGVNFFK